jgi:hypothetical protein
LPFEVKAVIVLVIVAGLLLTSIPVPASQSVVVDVKTDGIVFRPDTTFDLVAANGRSADAAGMTLDPPYIHLRGDSATAPAYRRVLPDTSDVAVSAFALQRLDVSDGCVLYLDRLDRGWMRVGILPAPAAPTTCEVRGRVWSGEPSALDSLTQPPGWDSAVPELQPIELHATPAPGRPASLTFRPAFGLRLRRIPVTQLSFESREQGPMVESGILGGTIRLPAVGNETHTVFMRDTLSLGEVTGTILGLTAGDSTAGDTLATLFRGTASSPRIGSESLKPKILTWMYHQDWLRFALGLGLTAFGIVAGTVKAWNERKRRGAGPTSWRGRGSGGEAPSHPHADRTP